MNDNELKQKAQKWKEEQRSRLLNYDKKRHLELLNHQGDEYTYNSELEDCSIILINQLQWTLREEYLELLEDYKTNKITTSKFLGSFHNLMHSIEKAAKLLESNKILLSPHEKSLDFALLLLEIEDCYAAYAPDPDSYEIGEVEYRSIVEKTYLDIQNLLIN